MLSGYATAVFDCDGVILDSNRVKTEAFRHTAQPYGVDAADALVAYHVANGGISRYAKFKYLLEDIVPAGQVGPDLQTLLNMFSNEVRAGLLNCAVAPGMRTLRATYPDQRWLIVSGADQIELREIIATRGLDDMFDAGIFGSPDTKETILARELEINNIRNPGLFAGDSIYDHRAATQAGLDFVFVSDWSEVQDWPQYVDQHSLKAVPNLAALVVKDDDK